MSLADGPNGPLTRCLALLDYDDGARALVAGLKYGGDRTAVSWIARAAAERLLAAGERPHLVTWVPCTADRIRRLGLDPAAVIARAVGVAARRRAAPTLERLDDRHQVGRGRADRLVGPTLAARHVPVAGCDVVVVDDVATTGASLRAAARALTGAGARTVTGLAFAHRRYVGALSRNLQDTYHSPTTTQ